MSRREDLLDSLVADLEPVAPAPDLRLLVGGWLLLSALYVVVLTHWLGIRAFHSSTPLARTWT